MTSHRSLKLTRAQRGLVDFLNNKLLNPHNFKSPYITETIFNFDTTKDASFNLDYQSDIKRFIESITPKLLSEIDKPQPYFEFIQYDKLESNPNDVEYTRKLLEKYKTLYTPADSHLVKFTDIYSYAPYRLTRAAYVDLENSYGLKEPITTMSDISSVLDQRITGLKLCKTDYSSIEYYSKELEVEQSLRPQDVKTRCDAIQWDENKYDVSTLKQRLVEFFSKLNPKQLELELECCRLYLNIQASSPSSRITKDEFITYVLDNQATLQKHFVFGFNTDYEKYKLLPELFNAGIKYSEESYTKSCHYLVNWTIFLNELYTRCTVLTNKSIISPVRFIIPDRPRYQTPDGNYKIRDAIVHHDLFNDSTTFLGVLVMKYHGNDRANGKKSAANRYFIYWVFKNNAKEQPNDKRFDFMEGVYSKYLIINFKLQQVHDGFITPKHNVTHTELTQFQAMSQQGLIDLYLCKLDEKTIFITKKDVTIPEELKYKLVKIELLQEFDSTSTIIIKKTQLHFKIITINSNSIAGGGMTKLDLQLSGKLESSILTTSNDYEKFASLNKLINYVDYNEKNLLSALKQLYQYILIDPREIYYSYIVGNKIAVMRNNDLLPKYRPINLKFYVNFEIDKNFNFFNKMKRVLVIGQNVGAVEYIKYKDFRIKELDFIMLTKSHDKNIKLWQRLAEHTNMIYKFNIITPNMTSLYNLIKPVSASASASASASHVIYHYYQIDEQFSAYHRYYNILNLFVGALIGLTNTEIGGNFLFHIGSVLFKSSADIYLMLKPYFKESHLYHPEYLNPIKESGTQAVFKGFKGISHTELQLFLDILEQLKVLYPNGMLEDFNESNDDERKLHEITKPLNHASPFKCILGLINISMTNAAYSEIIDFNNKRYLDARTFIERVVSVIYDKVKYKSNAATTSLLYCKKYDIPMFYSKLESFILAELYGIHQPLNIEIKTKVTKSTPSMNTIINRIEMRFDKNKNKNKNTKKIFNTKIVNLLEYLEDINNRVEQAGKLIDSRRDLYELPKDQNFDWWKINRFFRFYKHADDYTKVHLDERVRYILDDKRISQAWLKMMEILVECNIINTRPLASKLVYKSFHICEAPGTFIHCLNYYINTIVSGRFSGLEWNAQSLNPKKAGVDIGDTFGLINKYPTRWHWGVDGTGDISNPANVESYREYTNDVDLITSDCGLKMGNPDYYKAAYNSLLAILKLLPKGGSMIYKILTPIEDENVWTLIFECYKRFDKLIFFKPIQNFHSREFYIIGKNYKTTLVDVDVNITMKARTLYPIEFVSQVTMAMEKLDGNFIYAIERNIYYIDNFKNLSMNLLDSIPDYFNEKNIDWIKKYKIVKQKRNLL
jgi:hypothetical protein